MNKTQDHINIAQIKEDLLILKDGGGALVLQTNAVNFGLLSEREQLAIIFSFGQMLNSLSYAIQIVVHSSRLDISSYVNLLDIAGQKQTNPLLSQMIGRYKQFIQTTIKENEVLDKKFYIVIPLSGLEMGFGFKNQDEKVKKAKAMLVPRRDQIIRQLNRIGLKSNQLTNIELVKLFFEVYNPPNSQGKTVHVEPVTLSQPQTAAPTITLQTPQRPTVNQPQPTPSLQDTNSYTQKPRNHPFVVEELTDSV